MDVVRIGMVGACFGATLHMQNLIPMRGRQVEVVGICSKSRESAEAFAQRFGIPFVTTEFRALLDRKDVDVVDLCVPPSVHHIFAIQAAEAGKHVIIEKPLTGYFGEPGDPEPIGEKVSRTKMLEGARKNARAVQEAVRRHKVRLGYAENWVYAPPVAKLRRLIRAAGGSILDVRAEECHSGSHSTFARQWKFAGGGALLRMGVHSVGACLHLKAYEGEIRAEKIETKAGWTFPSPDEDWFRGYSQEIRDFVESIQKNREPLAGVDLAVDCVEVIYAAYLSAAEGRRVTLAER